jgi:hypothetical protein
MKPKQLLEIRIEIVNILKFCWVSNQKNSSFPFWISTLDTIHG